MCDVASTTVNSCFVDVRLGDIESRTVVLARRFVYSHHHNSYGDTRMYLAFSLIFVGFITMWLLLSWFDQRNEATCGYLLTYVGMCFEQEAEIRQILIDKCPKTMLCCSIQSNGRCAGLGRNQQSKSSAICIQSSHPNTEVRRGEILVVVRRNNRCLAASRHIVPATD